MREMTDQERRVVARVRGVIPDVASMEMIHEVVCGTRSSDGSRFDVTGTLADFQMMWHNSPEGTEEERFAFSQWDVRAKQELAGIPVVMMNDTECEKKEAQGKLKELFYNAPPGGLVRRMIVTRLLDIFPSS